MGMSNDEKKLNFKIMGVKTHLLHCAGFVHNNFSSFPSNGVSSSNSGFAISE
jgi:hypothetical protein